jgi:hypothetical protein
VLKFCVKIFFLQSLFQSTQYPYEKREGAGSRSIPLTNESKSGRPKNVRILRIRIPNTGFGVDFFNVTIISTVQQNTHSILIHTTVSKKFALPGNLPSNRVPTKQLYRYRYVGSENTYSEGTSKKNKDCLLKVGRVWILHVGKGLER